MAPCSPGATTPSATRQRRLHFRTTPASIEGLAQVIAISGGGYFSLALAADGSVFAWGNNLANHSTTKASATRPAKTLGLSNVAAISAGVYHSVALLKDGSVRAWGSNYAGAWAFPPTSALRTSSWWAA